MPKFRQPRSGLQLERADGLALQVVVAQHERADFTRHAGEQAFALTGGEVMRLNDGVQQDLEVDLDVGGVDAGGVVDEIGVEASARERILDAPALREAEVAPLADHSGLELPAVD